MFGCLLDPLLQGRAYVMSNQLPLTSEAIDQVFGRAWNQDHGSAYRFTVPHAGTGQQLVKIWQVKIQVDVSPLGGGPFSKGKFVIEILAVTSAQLIFGPHFWQFLGCFLNKKLPKKLKKMHFHLGTQCRRLFSPVGGPRDP